MEIIVTIMFVTSMFFGVLGLKMYIYTFTQEYWDSIVEGEISRYQARTAAVVGMVLGVCILVFDAYVFYYHFFLH